MEETIGTTPGSAGQSGADTSLIQETKEQAQQVVQKTQQAAGQLADQAREQIKSQAENQKERAAGSLENVALALRTTGDQLRQNDVAVVGTYADSAAELVERFSGYLRDRNLEQMMAEIGDFGRRQPALFLGGAFALGFLASRFLKSSSPSGSYAYRDYAMGTGNGGSRTHRLPTAYERAAETTTRGTPAWNAMPPSSPSTNVNTGPSVTPEGAPSGSSPSSSTGP